MTRSNFVALSVAISLSLITTTATAVTAYLPSGSNLSYGDTNHGQTVHSYINNPAAAGTIDPETQNNFQFGIVTFGVGLEYGDVNNLFDTVDAQINKFENTGTSILTNVNTPAEADAQIAAFIADLNTTMTTLDQDGYGKAYTTLHLPFAPFVLATGLLGGNWTFDANISAIAKLRVLADNINYAGAASTTDDVNIDVSGITQAGNPIGITVANNDSTLLTRAAAISELSLGYSTQVNFGSSENFAVGVRGKYYRVGLAQINQRLSGVLDGSEKIFDALTDADYTDSSDFGIDIGIIWAKPNFQLGASMENINEPSFEYNLIDLTGYNLNGPIVQRLNRVINYTMEAQFKLEGSLYTDNQAIALNTSLDGNAISDPFGDQYQWLSTNISFNFNSWIIPDVRVGYRANLAGTELTYATLGLSLFKEILTLDVAYGLEEVVLDGTTVPRSFGANIGIQASF